MRKMKINGVPHTWKNVSFTNPGETSSYSIIVAWPENEPGAAPLYLIDNNGTFALASFSFANWLPALGITFHD